MHYPDFFNNATVSWWTSLIQGLHNQLPFDGLWIDMNEASNFCTGDVCSDPGESYHDQQKSLSTQVFKSKITEGTSGDLQPVAAGNIEDNTDFVCLLSCSDGTSAAGSNAAGLPSAGIFNPPYLINNNGTQLDIKTKVHAVQ